MKEAEIQKAVVNSMKESEKEIEGERQHNKKHLARVGNTIKVADNIASEIASRSNLLVCVVALLHSPVLERVVVVE